MKKQAIKMALIATLIATGTSIFGSTVSAANIQHRTRLGGANRYETAVAISKEFASCPCETITNLLLCSDTAYADATASSPFSVYKNAPILLTGKDKIPAVTMNRIKEMKDVKNIYILGGTGVISPAIETQLRGMGYNVERLGGADRYETNRIIMSKIPKEKWGSHPKILNGKSWRQALTCAVDTRDYQWKTKDASYVNPIFLENPDNIKSKEDLQKYADMFKDTRAYWEGVQEGTFQVYLDTDISSNASNHTTEGSREVDKLLGGWVNAVSSDYQRANQYEINPYINRDFRDYPIMASPDDIPYKEEGALLTNGEIFPDSLAVSPLSAKHAMPIVFANRDMKDALSCMTNSMVDDLYTSVYGNVKEVYYVGGTGVLPDGRECVLYGHDR